MWPAPTPLRRSCVDPACAVSSSVTSPTRTRRTRTSRTSSSTTSSTRPVRSDLSAIVLEPSLTRDISYQFTRPSLVRLSSIRRRVDPALTCFVQPGWRRIIAQTALWGIPTAAFSTALSFFDGYRTEVLPANMLQAQRDYFGAHTWKVLPEHANTKCSSQQSPVHRAHTLIPRRVQTLSARTSTPTGPAVAETSAPAPTLRNRLRWSLSIREIAISLVPTGL